jgi:cobalt-zinc-cadmium efflux system membrane fusion protein
VASVAGSGATQLAFELFARSAVEQDAGVRTRVESSAGSAAGATRETPALAVLASTPAPPPAAPLPAAPAAAPLPAAVAPADVTTAESADRNLPSPALLALARDTPTRLPDGSIFLPMAIQRLIGLRTEISRVEPLAASSEIAGRIVSSRDVAAIVQPVQTGVIEAADGPLPRVGMRVERGQLLAYQRPLLDAARRAELDAKIADLHSQIQMGEQRIDRLREVWLIRYRQSKIDAVTAEIVSYRRQLGIYEALLTDRSEIRAQTAGIISRVNFVVGQIVEPQSVLFEIVDPSRLWVEAAAFDPAAAQDIGAARAVTVEGDVLQLRFIGGGMTLQNQSLPLQFEVVGTVAAAQIGKPVTVLITRGHAQLQGIRLPTSALVRNGAGETVVWERLSAESFLSRPVTAEPLDGATIGITGGLTANMRIVTAGSAMLSQVR